MVIKRIVIVCSGFNKYSVLRQPWYQIYEIGKRSVKKGIAVTVISDNPASVFSSDTDGIRVRNIRHLTSAAFFRNPLARIILEESPDIVLWYGSLLGAMSLRRLSRIGKPLVLSIDSDVYRLGYLLKLPFLEIVSHLMNPLWRFFLLAILPKPFLKAMLNSDSIGGIIVPTNYLREKLLKIGVSPTKVAVIRSAFNKQLGQTSLNPDLLKKSLAVETGDSIITYFGSPCTLRGSDIFVRSIPQMLLFRRNLRFFILSRVGKGESWWLAHKPEEDYLKRLIIESEIQDKVQLISGIMQKHQLRDFLHISDVVVLPFRMLLTESPTSILEAMSLGKVVISTGVGSIPEIIGQRRGVLIPTNDAVALTYALLEVLDNPKQYAQLGDNARKFALAIPEWREITQQVLDLLEKLQQEYVRHRVENLLNRRLFLKQRWQIWKNSPLALYRRMRRRIAYRVFGFKLRESPKERIAIDLGVDEFGRRLTDCLQFYIRLLKERGMDLHSAVVLGSRAKGRWSPRSDTDFLVVATNIPKGFKGKRVLSDAPIFAGISSEAFSRKAFLSALETFNIAVLDALYYGRVLYDDGFWSNAKDRLRELEEEYPVLDDAVKHLIYDL